MDFSVRHEVYVFLCSALAGAVIGVVRDCFLMIKKKGGEEKLLSDILDIIFWSVAAVIMFSVIFFANNGHIRGFEFLGVILGAIIYSFTVSRAVIAGFDILYKIFLRIFKFFFKILLTPLVFLYNIVFKGIMFIFRPVYDVLRRIYLKIRRRMLLVIRITRRTAKKS